MCAVNTRTKIKSAILVSIPPKPITINSNSPKWCKCLSVNGALYNSDVLGANQHSCWWQCDNCESNNNQIQVNTSLSAEPYILVICITVLFTTSRMSVHQIPLPKDSFTHFHFCDLVRKQTSCWRQYHSMIFDIKCFGSRWLVQRRTCDLIFLIIRHTHTHTPLRGIRRVRHQNKQTTPPSIHSHTQTHKLMTKSKKSWTMTRYYACCKVCGKTHGLRRCSRCKSVCYCSEVHQQIDWRVHKIECKKFAANMAQNASKFQCWSIILK